MSLFEKTYTGKLYRDVPPRGICLAFVRVKRGRKGKDGRNVSVYHPYVLITARKVIDKNGTEHIYATLPERDFYRADTTLDPQGEFSRTSAKSLSLGKAGANMFLEYTGLRHAEEEDMGAMLTRGVYLSSNQRIMARDDGGHMTKGQETVIFRFSLGYRDSVPDSMGSYYPEYFTESMKEELQFARENARFVEFTKVMNQLRPAKQEISGMKSPYNTNCEVFGLRFPCNPQAKSTLLTTTSLYALELFAKDKRDVFKSIPLSIAAPPGNRTHWVEPMDMTGKEHHSEWMPKPSERANNSDLMRIGTYLP